MGVYRHEMKQIYQCDTGNKNNSVLGCLRFAHFLTSVSVIYRIIR